MLWHISLKSRAFSGRIMDFSNKSNSSKNTSTTGLRASQLSELGLTGLKDWQDKDMVESSGIYKFTKSRKNDNLITIISIKTSPIGQYC
jgi:hypothetical protein